MNDCSETVLGKGKNCFKPASLVFHPRERHFRRLTIMRGRHSFVEISIRGWKIRSATLTSDISALSKKKKKKCDVFRCRSSLLAETILRGNAYDDRSIAACDNRADAYRKLAYRIVVIRPLVFIKANRSTRKHRQRRRRRREGRSREKKKKNIYAPLFLR